ncbi:MAG: hypothetical protein IH895_04185 [Planctomycetes bacterium]|nr:hypothetical protein [Planctomycetota bacterium]
MSTTIDRIDMLLDTTLNQFNNVTLTIIGIQDPPDPLRETGVFSLNAATYIMSSTGNNEPEPALYVGHAEQHAYAQNAGKQYLDSEAEAQSCSNVQLHHAVS